MKLLIECAGCGTELEAEFQPMHGVMAISVCRGCWNEDGDLAYQEGYDAGYMVALKEEEED